MLIRVKDLLNIADEKIFDVDIKLIEAKDNPYLKRLIDNKGYICFYYDYEDKLCVEYKLEGKMVCPDSITLNDVYQDYCLDGEDRVAFKEDEEGIYFYGDQQLADFVYNVVLPEVPIIVENCDKTRYYSGDGWSIMSEEEYDKSQKDKLDPRLQILRDYKEEK